MIEAATKWTIKPRIIKKSQITEKTKLTLIEAINLYCDSMIEWINWANLHSKIHLSIKWQKK